MNTSHNSPMNNGEGEGNDFKAQLKRFKNYLKNNIATASMVTKATGIPQKNITRYKRRLEKAGRLWEVYETRCKETGYIAAYLTTDPNKAPNYPEQLKLNF